jgi:esterase
MTTILNYQQQGQGADIILIHGLFGSLENLAMIAKALKDNYRVTSIDVRNHGASFHKNDMSYPNLAKDVIEVLDHLAIKNAHFLGHSMGGKIAMQIALYYGNRVNSLMIADIAPVKYPANHQQIINGLQAINLDKITSRKDADQHLANFVDEPSIRQFLLRNLAITEHGLQFKCNLEYIAKGYVQIIEALEGEKQYLGDTLFIKGGNSDYILAEHKEKITTHFPHSKAKVIQGAGHWLHAEKSIAFNKIINDFLTRI